MTDYGIDISHYNLVNDWNAVRRNNITYASIKLTESTGYIDQAAARHVAAARTASIHVGGYHFARNTPVTAQVQNFAARIRTLGLDAADAMAPMLDMEAAELRTRANPFIAEFITHLRATTGIRKMFVYANLDWFRNVLRPADWLDKDVLLWIARYNGDPGHPGWAHPQLAVHQHSSQGRVPGIPGNVDRDATIGAYTVKDLLIGRPARESDDELLVAADHTGDNPLAP